MRGREIHIGSIDAKVCLMGKVINQYLIFKGEANKSRTVKKNGLLQGKAVDHLLI